MNFAAFISFYVIALFSLTIATSVTDTVDADATLADLCLSPNRTALVTKNEKCIKSENVKKIMNDCRETVYGIGKVGPATEIFCAADVNERNEFKVKFENCTLSKGLTGEQLAEEFDENCGFCKNRDVLAKVDACLKEGHVKNEWLNCRQQTAGTRDPQLATEQFCALSKQDRHQQDELFYVCLGARGVTKDMWHEASSSCTIEPDSLY